MSGLSILLCATLHASCLFHAFVRYFACEIHFAGSET